MWEFYDKTTGQNHPTRFLNKKIYGENSKRLETKDSPLAHLKSRLRDLHLSHFDNIYTDGRVKGPKLSDPYLPRPYGLGNDWDELALEAIQGDLGDPRHENVMAWEKYWLKFAVAKRNQRALKAMME
jgi:hypothetical protein